MKKICIFQKYFVLLQSKMNFCGAKLVINIQNNKKLHIIMTKFQEFYQNLRVGDAESVRNDIEQHVSQP